MQSIKSYSAEQNQTCCKIFITVHLRPKRKLSTNFSCDLLCKFRKNVPEFILDLKGSLAPNFVLM